VFEEILGVSQTGRGRLEAPKSLQSWPGIVHGGCLVGLVDAAAIQLGRAPGPRRVDGRLTSSVPIETALDLQVDWQVDRGADTVGLTILQDGHTLTSGSVADLRAAPATAGAWIGGGDGSPLPMADYCLESTLSTSSGTLIATASIVFRGGTDYSERQMAYFKPRTPPEVFRRMFPNYS
jgi:hypothetical protein